MKTKIHAQFKIGGFKCRLIEESKGDFFVQYTLLDSTRYADWMHEPTDYVDAACKFAHVVDHLVMRFIRLEGYDDLTHYYGETRKKRKRKR